MAVNSLQKQRAGSTGRPFPKGQSGNPAGRPPGARNHATLAAEVLLEGDAEALTRRAIERALEGDVAALRLCLERVMPRRRSRALAFELPPLDGPENLSGAIGSVLQEVAQGRLLLDEGAALVGMMESQRKAMETIDLESRLRALESQTLAGKLHEVVE
jgi:Family of unknown function (DUF5681)